MAKTNSSSKKSKKKYFYLTLCFVLVLGAVVAGLIIINNQRKARQQPTIGTLTTNQKEGINFDPPTEEERNDAETAKDDIVRDQQSPASTDTNSKRKVTPTIAYLDSSTVNAYVTGVFEETGTCTLTLTNGSQTITKTSKGFGNASYTQCEPMSLSDVKATGEFNATIGYSSPSATGISASKKVTL